MTTIDTVFKLSTLLGEVLTSRHLKVATAESCTAGAISAAITDIAGSSAWFDRGFICYSNQAKNEMLHVDMSTLKEFGAVSERVIKSMANNAVHLSDADVSVAISGIAGPGGGSKDKPVGTVWISWAGDRLPTQAQCFNFTGNRQDIRQQALVKALEGLIERSAPKHHSRLTTTTKHRYFFALKPNCEVSTAVLSLGTTLLNSGEAVDRHREDLHLTLCYLGPSHPDFVDKAIELAKTISIKPFELCIDTPLYFKKKRIVSLGLSRENSSLFLLARQLNSTLLECGFKPEKRSFTPHITLKRTAKPVIRNIDNPIIWQVNSFYLMRSTLSKSSPKYEVMAEFPA
jgi:2'-5' RNA ligase